MSKDISKQFPDFLSDSKRILFVLTSNFIFSLSTQTAFSIFFSVLLRSKSGILKNRHIFQLFWEEGGSSTSCYPSPLIDTVRWSVEQKGLCFRTLPHLPLAGPGEGNGVQYVHFNCQDLEKYNNLFFFFFKGSGLQLTLRQEEIPLDPDIASPSFLSFQAILFPDLSLSASCPFRQFCVSGFAITSFLSIQVIRILPFRYPDIAFPSFLSGPSFLYKKEVTSWYG